MLPVIAEMWPAGDEYQHAVESFGLELAKLPGSFSECCEAIVLRRISFVVPVALWFQVAQDARAHVRNANQIMEKRSASDLFFERNEQSCLDRIASVPLGHVNVVAGDWNDAR